MELDIIERTETRTRLALKGRMDTAGVDLVETRVNAALSRGGDGILDLSEVSFLSSHGIRLLVTAAKMLARRGSQLVLVAPRPLVDQALRHSSIDDIIPVTPDMDAALAFLGS